MSQIIFTKPTLKAVAITNIVQLPETEGEGNEINIDLFVEILIDGRLYHCQQVSDLLGQGKYLTHVLRA